MNNIQIFKNSEFNQVKALEKENENKYTGFFYVLEWSCLVKIGSTKRPYQRIMQLKRIAEKYGDSRIGSIALSVPHTNYVINERKLHEFFAQNRKEGSELFDIGFEKAVSQLPQGIEYADDSEAIQKRAEDFLNGMKDFMLGGNRQ